ncbi:acyl-homoserine-lactone synthase [Erwinia rhapontici]|uniref:acyl-homoserine-lactone synthase n=1 Tax=Erwinia rhapontici TaxID=55212 RepID=UPI0013312B6B|nr:acyl-homoserine-lactone synthase [Erwinia rhapontici]MBP2156377.1 acyl homoserine lactone synthase [Erwinia rhapontici]
MNIELCTINDLIKNDFFFKCRCEVFSKRLNWDVIVNNGKEYDQYDNENATYIIIFSNYNIIASVRLIETKHPHLLTGSFYNYFSSKSDSTIEATRFFVRKNLTSSKEPICQILFSSMIEYCITKGHSSIMAIVGSGMNKLLNKYGWTHEIIEECIIDDKTAYLVSLPISLDTCKKIKVNASIDPCKYFIPSVK